MTPIPDLLSKVFVDADEAAILLSVPVETIKNLHRTGQLPGIMVGKHCRWRPADLKRFAESAGIKQVGGPLECGMKRKPQGR